MWCDVILSKENNKYKARVKEWHEVVVEEKSRDQAIIKIKSKLIDYLTKKVELIQIDIPFRRKTENPWLEKFGWFKDDTTFDDLQSEIEVYRKEIDHAMRHEDRWNYMF